MREKILHLVVCVTLLILSTGAALGQTGFIDDTNNPIRSWAWGSGTCATGLTIAGTGDYIAKPGYLPDYETGIYIGGHRQSTWSSWNNIWWNTTTNPYNSGTDYVYSYGYNVISSFSSSSDCSGEVSSFSQIEVTVRFIGGRWQKSERTITYTRTCPPGGPATNNWTSTSPPDNWVNMWASNGYEFTGQHNRHPHLQHKDNVVVQIEKVTLGSHKDPHHYRLFHWQDPTWGHRRDNYRFVWNTDGTYTITPIHDATDYALIPTIDGKSESVGSSNTFLTTSGYADEGIIKIMDDSTSVRLHSPMSNSSSNTHPVLDFSSKKDIAFRFDAAFAGTPAGVEHRNTPNTASITGPWTAIGHKATPLSLSGIGFWTGTSLTHYIYGGGNLWLGPATSGQDKIHISTKGAIADSTLTVANYLDCGDVPDFLPFRGHGVLFDPATISNTTTDAAKIIVKNDQINCHNLPCTDISISLADSAINSAFTWLKLDAYSVLPNLFMGNADIWADGNVYFRNNVYANSAVWIHNIFSKRGSIVWNGDYIISNTDGTNGHENYYVLGNCCNSQILAHGVQSYTMTGAGRFGMTTAYGKITMDKNFLYTGVNGDMNMFGVGGIVIGNGGVDPQSVFVNISGIGNVTFKSDHGSILMKDSLVFNQTSGTTTNGLTLLASGSCDITDWCGGGGYINIVGPVVTNNVAEGFANLESENHYIRLENTLTHKGVEGDLTVLAGSAIDDDDFACDTDCDDAEDDLPAVAPHSGRGYLWVMEPVSVAMNNASGDEGNAMFRSYGDIVQFSDSVTFIDNSGSNLLVDGLWGIRSLGVTSITNNNFNATATPSGSSSLHLTASDNPNNVDYAVTDGQGHATYLSSKGYVDFGAYVSGAPASDINKFSYVTNGAAPDNESALLIQGHSRVYFADSVTITMGSNSPTKSTTGNAKIYSPAGWVMFGDTVEYTGTNGDLIVYANGGSTYPVNYTGGKTDILRRSELNDANTCDETERGGFILFDSLTLINYANGADDGQTWIRSNFDDVVMGDMFLYTNVMPTTIRPAANGEFIMQSGQDIYGKSFEDIIQFNQAGDSSILLEAKKSIHLQQMLHIDRTDAQQGDITLKAGYNSFAETNPVMSPNPASHKDIIPSAKLEGLGWAAKGDNNPRNYVSRFAPDDSRAVTLHASMIGGDIWFEGHVLIDLVGTTSPASNIATTLRAYNSVFIDSTFEYIQGSSALTPSNDNVLLFAEIGNIEAAVTRQSKSDFADNGDYVADDSVVFTFNNNFSKEFRMQAGNQIWGENPTGSLIDIDAEPTDIINWRKGNMLYAEYYGNILYNKPFKMYHDGTGHSVISAARDIETQIMAPFTFNYTNAAASSGNMLFTAGRHIETHAMMRFDYPINETTGDITMQAGRLDQARLSGSDDLCKGRELGTSLTDPASSGLLAFNPDVETGGVNGSVNNAFADDGSGFGSILLFDSLEFNYNGRGKIFMVAENGNIESDPYLHRRNQASEPPVNPANPGLGGILGNLLDGYMPYIGYPAALDNGTMQHEAQITFNHGGSGVTQMKAIDIRLHDKLAYYTTQTAPSLDRANGQFYMTAYDSILTRNIEYVNPFDTGSVFITTAKYKGVGGVDCGVYRCDLPYPAGIHQGHIVLGYGADNGDDDYYNMHDSIIFNFAGNGNVEGANVKIHAGFAGFESNSVTGKYASGLFAPTSVDIGKGYGGNITYDFMKVHMARGNRTTSGYFEMLTPNGNIWGKDSLVYRGYNGDMKIDAGLGSVDDPRAIRWSFGNMCPGGDEETLNTFMPTVCEDPSEWRTGNIMTKGASLSFQDGSGNVTFRTREGFIDTYDAFTVDSMRGSLLKYASSDNSVIAARNLWGDVSERDFKYTPIRESGSVFFGADDNIMMNYGYSNGHEISYDGRGFYDIAGAGLTHTYNPYYSTSYKTNIDANRSVFNVNYNGYIWYRRNDVDWATRQHRLYRGGNGSGFTGVCGTVPNGARDLEFNFDLDANGMSILSGGLAVVASNYVDMFTKFTYQGGTGTGISGMNILHGEGVAGFGLFIKSQFNATGVNTPENRRASCRDCGELSVWPMGDDKGYEIPEMTYVGFHDDARIYTHNQKSWIEAPVIEFFGHAELNTFEKKGNKTNITLKGDSLIFHDSLILDDSYIKLLPFTADATQRANDMRYGVINDKGHTTSNYNFYGPAIRMSDRGLPVLELGYQRCFEPGNDAHYAPNLRSVLGLEQTPMVGGDIIVTFKHGYSMPIFNTVVANHARISFTTDLMGGEYEDSFIRTDLLRIRNKVEFYTEPNSLLIRSGKFVMATPPQMDDLLIDNGVYVNHLHTEPGSELSIPGEDSLVVIPTTVVGGFGTIHENIRVKANGILAPGFASLMEGDCQTPYNQGKLSIHNLQMEKDAVLRISISNRHTCYDEDGNSYYCSQTDTISVHDSIYFAGKVPLVVLPETEKLDPGCYLFMEYGDSLGNSKEYVSNLVLSQQRYGEYYFSLYFGEPGKVYLCVSTFPMPEVQRKIIIPEVTGVITNPIVGEYYVKGHQNYSFTAWFTGEPLKVKATGYYSGTVLDLDLNAKIRDNGVYEYTIYQVVEPWTVEIGPALSTVGIDGINNQRVWSYKNTLYINAEREDIVSIYNITGVLYKKVEIGEGLQTFTLERGAYIVTLKDGTVYKIIIK